MANTIAVAGKGGTGKSTISSLIIAQFLEDKETPVLGIDADPNSTLNEWLGVEVNSTLGDLMADMLNKKGKLPPGMDKKRYLERNLQLSLEEQIGYDLLVMGRTEGPGCYCSVNNILKDYIDRLTPNYENIVMDNEAGMEHLSRRTTHGIDTLLIISDPSPIGIRSAGRIYKLEKNLEIDIRRAFLVINRVPGGELPDSLMDEIEETGLELLAVVPNDEQILEFSLERKSLLDLPASSPARKAVKKMLEDLKA